MENKGLNYAGQFSNTNKDIETGIRYGVINQNAVGQAWYDESIPYYGKGECNECGTEFDTSDGMPDECSECGRDFEEHSDMDYIEAVSFFYASDGYEAEASTDSGDIFITKSPYFTYAQFCSPCAPGAVHLENPLKEFDENQKGYCFGHDWFENEVAPYPVYSVKTGELVKP